MGGMHYFGDIRTSTTIGGHVVQDLLLRTQNLKTVEGTSFCV